MSDSQKIVGLLIPASYLVGSIPFGLIVGILRGIDPRKSGSGNIGATNLGRLLGGRYFALVFVLDMLKGMLPMIAAGVVIHRGQSLDSNSYLLWLAVGLAAILGHMFSVFLRFRGGKGVATSAGVMLGLWPYFTIPGLIAIGGFIVIFLATRYVSVGSILSAGMFPLAYLAVGVWRNWPVFGAQWPLLAFAVLVAGLIIYKHRGNISRLRAGTENKFARKAVVDT